MAAIVESEQQQVDHKDTFMAFLRFLILSSKIYQVSNIIMKN